MGEFAAQLFRSGEGGGLLGTHNGTSEVSMRGQFRAWVAAMTAGGAGA